METGKKNNTDEQAGTENQTGIKELEGSEDHASTKVQRYIIKIKRRLNPRRTNWQIQEILKG